MSEQIKITIVSENDKLNNAVDNSEGKFVVLTHDPSATLMSTLLKNHLISGSFCEGRGDCGRCRVRFLQGAVMPTALERSVMEPEELRQGYRLACLSRPTGDCTIVLAFSDEPEQVIVADMIGVTENNDQIGQKKSQTKKQKPIVTKSHDIKELPFGNTKKTEGNNTRNSADETKEAEIKTENAAETLIAVDLGTTTIAMQLVEMRTGRILDTWCGLNPQRRYGTDVLSRIQASCEGAREELQRLAEEALEQGVAQFRRQGTAIRCMCIAGNTTMEHLLMGHNVSALGQSPFVPVERGLQLYPYGKWDFPTYITPVISAFVGGDIVAGLYACGLLPERRTDGGSQGNEERSEDERRGRCAAGRSSTGGNVQPVRFLIDLGTNGEMAITDGTRMIVTATAAGPAFEGGAGTGIMGSDMVACTAALLRAGIADESGLLAEPYFTEGVALRRDASGAYVPVTSASVSTVCASDIPTVQSGLASHDAVPVLHIRQSDVRAIQMAKAAVRAGAELLWRRMGEPESVQVYLAGGFGYYLDVEAAFRIGLLPERMRGSVRAVGNTSLGGACLLGRDLWLGMTDGAALERALSSIESLNLAAQEEFETLYIRYMDLSLS